MTGDREAERVRVGLATYFYNYSNEGTLLQAACLLRQLARTGHDAQIVRQYDPPKFRRIGRARTRRQRRNREFSESFPTTPEAWSTPDTDALWHAIGSRFDLVVVGSDEIWKLRFDHDGRPLHDDPIYIPYPNLYWPPPDLGVPRVAHAVSIGDTDVERIPGPVRAALARRLSAFSRIGVRDEHTADFVRSLGGRVDAVVPDPTFAVPFEGEWPADGAGDELRRRGIDAGRPLCILADRGVVGRLDLPAEWQVAGFESGLGLPVLVAENPYAWAALLGAANLVATTRMHVLIACLKHNVPCVVFDTRRKTTELARTFGVPLERDWRSVVRDWPHDSIPERLRSLREASDRFVESYPRPVPSSPRPSVRVPPIHIDVPRIGGCTVRVIPLAEATTLRIGGPATVVTPTDEAALHRALSQLASTGVPYRLLGAGSNVLAADEGPPFVVVDMRRLRTLQFEGERVLVGAGVRLPGLVHRLAKRGLGGLEYLVSVPGTVGGAVCRNAGRGREHDLWIGQHVERVDVFDGERTRQLSARDMEFDHRRSVLLDNPRWAVVSVLLRLPRRPASECRERVRARLRHVGRSQDHDHPSAGSVFLDARGGRLWLGRRIGGVRWSPRIPNWLQNVDEGTFADAMELIGMVDENRRALELDVWE